MNLNWSAVLYIARDSDTVLSVVEILECLSHLARKLFKETLTCSEPNMFLNLQLIILFRYLC